MRIFLNSCGYSRQDPAHEYRWKSLSGDPARDALEELSRKRFAGLSLGDLVESDSRMPSLVLARDNGDAILLATRILSLNRFGSQGDAIYNSLLLVGKQHHFLGLRRLATNLLASIPPQPNDLGAVDGQGLPVNLIQKVLDEQVSFDEANGYKFSANVDVYTELEAATEDLFSNMPVQQMGFRWRPRTGHNCFKLRQELAYELARFTLPLGDGPIAVATGIKSPLVAQQAEVWRSLNLLTEGISWQPLPVERRAIRRHDKAEALAGGYASPSAVPTFEAITSAIGLGDK